MSYSAADIERVLIEIGTGKKPSPPDTPELAALRRQLTAECAEIHAQGKDVEIPSELP